MKGLSIFSNMSLSATRINQSNNGPRWYRVEQNDWHFAPVSLLTLSLDEEVSLCDYVFLELLHGVVVFGAISFDEVDFAE